MRLSDISDYYFNIIATGECEPILKRPTKKKPTANKKMVTVNIKTKVNCPFCLGWQVGWVISRGNRVGHFKKKPGHLKKKPCHYNKKLRHLKSNHIFFSITQQILNFFNFFNYIRKFKKIKISAFSTFGTFCTKMMYGKIFFFPQTYYFS